MNIKNKVLLIVLVFALVASICVSVNAAALTALDSVVADANSGGSIDDSMTNAIGAIITITRIIAVGVAIIMLLVLAMKYMSAAPGDKAEIKKSAVIYVVGAIVLFAVGGILTIIQNFAGVIDT